MRFRIPLALVLALGALLTPTGPAADVIRRVCVDMKVDCPMRLLPWRCAQQEMGEASSSVPHGPEVHYHLGAARPRDPSLR
jgi:hypothetical protein